MSRKKVLTLLLVITMVTGLLLTAMPASAATGDWKLVWSDEFNGTSGTGADSNKWVYETGGGGFGNNELQYYTNRTDNVYIEQDPNNSSNRFLTIKAIKESYGGRQYTSGRIKTNGKFDFTYGKVEMRAKLPYGQGMWPAFWMLGSNIGSAGWPNCGEIDIMEFVGKDPTRIHGTLHGPNYNGGGSIGSWHENASGFSDAFHTYAIEWEPGIIRWYFDGQLYEKRTMDDLFGKAWVFDHNFFIILNLAVGGTWPGSPNSTTVFPQKYTIDYVRVYQREGGVYPAPEQRSLVQLKNAGNGRFVCADKQNSDYLYANRGSAGLWETFEQRDLGNGNITLIALSNYKYASASVSNNQLIASKETAGSSETFQLVSNSDGTKSLKCASNGKYVTVPGSSMLEATASTIGNAEKFTFISVNGVPLPPSGNIALNKAATASSSRNPTNVPAKAFDGNTSTRWESDWSDPQWITVDLGSSYIITGVKIVWETAAGKEYKIQVSADNTTWTDTYTVTNGTNGATLNATFPAKTGRYVRMYGTTRTTGYGYSIYEFEVYR